MSDKYQQYLCSREWGQRRELVKMRSGGVCERCRKNPGTAVHHLTYTHIYNEPLEDLVHICEPCHDYQHGRGNFDPAARRVYLAGPVVDNDDSWKFLTWRDKIFPTTDSQSRGCHSPDETINGWIYAGPTIDGEHGGPAGQHATIDGKGLASRCLAQIAACDVLFAWIDREHSVGTIVEITAATIHYKKPVFIAFATEKLKQHFYFVLGLGTDSHVFRGPKEAWRHFEKWATAR